MDMITSLQNPRVKLMNGLQTRPRTRRKERKMVLEGVRLLRDAIERGSKPEFVFYDPKTVDYEFLADLQGHNFEVLPVTPEVMQHVSDTQTPQGVIGVFPIPTPYIPRQPRSVLILDNVREPGNVGGMLRTAAAAGTELVILSPGCADPYNNKVLRSGMGAHFRIPVVEAGWEEINGYCEPLKVYLAAGNGEISYDQVNWRERWALVIGSEAHGVSESISGTRIRIPMAAATESLNATIAAAVILFEAQRQLR
ncbi:MAG: RNA methyltransferase [Anaerolineae bacterium]|jgi:TrmH family RNA methyltransferase|nr:RNA methyltransferase [Anaerolineae bacterium]